MSPQTRDAVDASALVAEAAAMASSNTPTGLVRRQIRVPSEAWQAWESAANAEQLDVQEWLRQVADDAAVTLDVRTMRPTDAGERTQSPRALRATPEQWATWEQAAEAAGVKLADWLRRVANVRSGFAPEPAPYEAPSPNVVKAPVPKVRREQHLFRATDEEWTTWGTAAAALGLSVGEWLRGAIRGALGAPSELRYDRAYSEERRAARSLTVAPEQRAAWEQAARAAGVSGGVWLRAAAERSRKHLEKGSV